MKKYIFTLLLFIAGCGPVYADRLDILEAAPNIDYCSISSDQFKSGAVAQAAGHARVIEEANYAIKELAEHGLPLPKRAMFVPEWNSLTDNERNFVTNNAFSGWDEAAKIGRPITEEEAQKMAQTVFEKCMYERTKNKRMGFTKTAAIDGAIV